MMAKVKRTSTDVCYKLLQSFCPIELYPDGVKSLHRSQFFFVDEAGFGNFLQEVCQLRLIIRGYPLHVLAYGYLHTFKR